MTDPNSTERPARPPGTLRLGDVAGIDVFVRSSWVLVAVLIAVILAPQIDLVAPGLGNLVFVAGLAFAVLLYLSVLLHEISHALMAKAFGFRVHSVTLHFLGGVTEIDGEADTPGREFWIAVVGPLTSLAVAAVAFGLTFVAPDGLLLYACQALAAANLIVGVFNLFPGLPLDGGRVLRSIAWAVTGKPLLATEIAGWAGRVIAVLVLGYPFVLSQLSGSFEASVYNYVIAFIIAAFLWGGASQAITSARVRRRLPALKARELARRAVRVPPQEPLSEALHRLAEARAGGIVVVDPSGRPTAIVDEHAVAATPQERRPWITCGTIARRLGPGLALPADISGETLIRAMQGAPAREYVLLESDGSLYGTLATADVDRAFAEGNLHHA